MTHRRVIAVFGISGVGKTTAIRKWLEGREDALHLQASALIKQGLADPVLDSEVLRRSAGDRVLANQDLLIEMFGRAVAASAARLVIFDGHLVIDTDERLVEIPLSVIAALRPRMLLHIEQTPETIAERRRDDTSRNRPVRALDILEQQQARSRSLCQTYGKRLSVEVLLVIGENKAVIEKIFSNQAQ